MLQHLADYSQHPFKNAMHDETVEKTKNSDECENILNWSNDDESDEHVNKKCKISNETETVCKVLFFKHKCMYL